MSSERSLIGRTVGGRYLVRELIGRGGSATVYRAEQHGSPEEVALKIIHPRLARLRLPAARFHREARAVARIDHPGCVRVLDWGVDDDWQYIAMELIAGDDLDQVLKREAPFTEVRAVSIARAVCDVLCAAHALGIVHRDLKPRNVRLLPDAGHDAAVKVLDFGLAKLIRRGGMGDETLPNALTRPESTLGTPSYMAPEQVRQRTVDERADLYSLGVILYEMVTGRRPIEGSDPVTVLLKLAKETPPPPSAHRPDIHPQLERLILRCLEKDPARRPESAPALRAMLAGLREELDERAEADPTRVMIVHPGGPTSDVGIASEPTFDADEPTDMKPTMLYRKGALPQLYRREEEVTDKTTRRWKPLDGSTLEAPTTEAVTAARAAVLQGQAKAARRRERPWLMVMLLLLAVSFLAWVLSNT